MKEMGVVFDSLVRELAAMREAAVQRLSALQAERDELEDKIRQAEEEIEQKVRADQRGQRTSVCWTRTLPDVLEPDVGLGDVTQNSSPYF